MKIALITSSNKKYEKYVKFMFSKINLNLCKYSIDLKFIRTDFDLCREWFFDRSIEVKFSDSWGFDILSEKNLPSHYKSLTIRPFLIKFFPNYDVYLWMDPDVLIQDVDVIDWYVRGALSGDIALTPEIDSAYANRPDSFNWKLSRMASYFGLNNAIDFCLRGVYFNAGIWAMKKESPVWTDWANFFQNGLISSNQLMICDQTALNFCLYKKKFRYIALPSIANWMCHLSPPVIDDDNNLYVSNDFSRRKIKALHFTANSKVMLDSLIVDQVV